MNVKDQYLRAHLARKRYDKKMGEDAREKGFVDTEGWIDYFLYDELVFSHRKNYYTKETFDEGLHSHHFYELIVYLGGSVEYIKNDTVVKPESLCFMCFPPGVMHTARLLSASEYERFVLYFSEDFFSYKDESSPMLDFLKKGDSAFYFNAKTEELKSIVIETETVLSSDTNYKNILAKAQLIRLFGILNSSEVKPFKTDELKDAMAEIKAYIDNNFAEISGISELAEMFFYSREHISRNFKKSFNISISEYINKRRVTESLKILKKKSVTETCFEVGFKSQSAFISAFVKNIGCLPSEYKKILTINRKVI